MSTRSKTIKIKDLSSPKGHPILGHLPQFSASNKHQVLERWVKECGDLFKINFVGKQFIVSANNFINDEILRLRPDKFRRFSKINEILEEMGVDGVFNAEGETWKKQRRPIAESLSLKKVRGFYPIISEKTEHLLNKWQRYAKEGAIIDVQREFMRYTVDITTAIAFGYELNTINNEEDDFQKHLELIFPMVNERITAPISYWRWIKLKKDRELDRALKAIEKIVYQFIDDAKKRLENNVELRNNPTNFLEALLVEQENETGFSDTEIYGNVFSILLAGEDTTSNSISWAMYYLAQHPEIVLKIREEAKAVYGQALVPNNDQELTQLKYTNAVAQEAIRIKPVTPNLYMQANEDLIIQNLEIPKGMTVMLQNKVAQTDENHFSNPDDFIPERWLRGGCPMHKNHNPDVMKAFGGGARFCPGKNLAMHEMVIAISTLCKRFNFKMSVKSNEITEEFAFTMFPQNLLIQLEAV